MGVGSWPLHMGTEEESTNQNLGMGNVGLVDSEGFCGALVRNFRMLVACWAPSLEFLF